jgi:hypothetical protein
MYRAALFVEQMIAQAHPRCYTAPATGIEDAQADQRGSNQVKPLPRTGKTTNPVAVVV